MHAWELIVTRGYPGLAPRATFFRRSAAEKREFAAVRLGIDVQVIVHGIDIVEVDRVEVMIAEHGERFLARVFTGGERAACEAGKRRDERLAARFAAKEAALKALGTGWRSGIAWTDVEVVSLPTGEPRLRVSGKAAEVAGELGITEWRVSLSHTEKYAVASVIGLG